MAINPVTGLEEEIKVEENTFITPGLGVIQDIKEEEIDRGDIPTIGDTGVGEPGELIIPGVTAEDTTPTFEIKGEDFVVDIDEEKKGETPVLNFSEDTIIDITTKLPKDRTEEENAMLRRFQAKKAFNAGKGLDAFGESIGASITPGTTQVGTLLDEGTLTDAKNRISSLNDAMARSSLASDGFSQTQIDQIMLRRGTEATIGTKEEDVALRLDQAKSDIENRGAERIKTLDRSLSFSGFGRSSTAVQKRDELQVSINNEIAQAQAKADLEVQLFKAQQEGAEATMIASIRKSLADASAKLKETETANAIDLAKANQELGLKADEALDAFLAGSGIADREDFTGDILKTKELGLGYFVDSEGNVVVDENNKPIIYKQPESAENAAKAPNVQFISAKADDFGTIIQPGGYFNKDTQEFHPINFGGDSNQSEFGDIPSVENTGFNIAEYTQIYRGSPTNPNGVDLAGKKGSAIKTPVAGEVIFVGENGGWGNQVQIKDANGQIHQFSHLDGSTLKEGQILTPGAMIGTMGNSGNVLKGDGTKPTDEELAAGRGTHLDYTVLDENGNALGLDVAMSFAGVPNTSGQTSSTSDAVSKGYKTPTAIKVYNQIVKEGGTPPDLASKDLNEGQSKSVGFANRMSADMEILQSKKNVIKDLGVLGLASYRKAFGTTLGNQIVPPDVQQFLQAESDFIKAQLRKESGATIPPDEEASFIKTNGILPGDSDEVIEQKFRNMENMLEAMYITAGPGASLIKSEDIPDGLDQDDVGFFGQEGTGAVFDQEDEDFFNNLD